MSEPIHIHPTVHVHADRCALTLKGDIDYRTPDGATAYRSTCSCGWFSPTIVTGPGDSGGLGLAKRLGLEHLNEHLDDLDPYTLIDGAGRRYQSE